MYICAHSVWIQVITSLEHQGGEEFCEGGSKFYIDSMYENNGYAYNLCLHILY